MRIGVPREASPETRVAITPMSLKKLAKAGIEVIVERGAGAASHFADADYEAGGAVLGSRTEALQADLIVSVGLPEVSELPQGATIACVADPFRQPAAVRACLAANITLLSMDLIPRRLSRAQSMDVNSSQDNLAGYKAVLLGAAHTPRAIPMMTTSAGTVKPARFVVMGSGVAGLQAIATAKRLGAVVYASDVRLAAKEQIESVGGRFIHVDGMEDFEDASGYAKPLTPEFIDKVNGVVNEVAATADVIITTARIFGRPAPVTVPRSALAGFKTGAVLVDMNADVGGNCEATEPGAITEVDGVTVIGLNVLPRTLPDTASMLYSNNLTSFATSLVKDGALVFDPADDILFGPPPDSPFHVPGMGGVLVCQGGALHESQTRLHKVVHG